MLPNLLPSMSHTVMLGSSRPRYCASCIGSPGSSSLGKVPPAIARRVRANDLFPQRGPNWEWAKHVAPADLRGPSFAVNPARGVPVGGPASLCDMKPRPFRFGVSGGRASRAEWLDLARKADDLGYSTLLLPDHFGRPLRPRPALLSAASGKPVPRHDRV